MIKIVIHNLKLKNFFKPHTLALFALVLVLFTCSLKGLKAGDAPPLTAEQVQAMIPQTLEALNAGRYDDALKTAATLMAVFPKEERAYELVVAALWGKKDLMGVIQAVFMAQKNGVQSPSLFEKQAEAFFLIQQPEASLESLARYEEAWRLKNG